MKVHKIKDTFTTGAGYIAKTCNATLTRIAVDLGAIASITYGADHLPDVSASTFAVFGAGAGLGLYKLDKLVSKQLKKHRRNKVMQSRVTTPILAATLALSGYSLADNAADFKNDLESIVSSKLTVNQNIRLPNFSSVQLARKGTLLGDVQRTYRWDPIIKAVEKRYGIPKGLLAGIVMLESYGDPLQPNSSHDGGIGLVHTQGTTAKQLGLKIYGNSHSARDTRHGKQLKEMFEKCGYELECIAKQDDRAHPVKNLDAIARYMREGYRTHGSWKAAAQWVHGPGHVGKHRGRRYLSRVEEKRRAFNTLVKAAEEDFNRRNSGITWKAYQDSFHRMCENFGLRQYK